MDLRNRNGPGLNQNYLGNVFFSVQPERETSGVYFGFCKNNPWKIEIFSETFSS